jgi:hypothetical protein
MQKSNHELKYLIKTEILHYFIKFIYIFKASKSEILTIT